MNHATRFTKLALLLIVAGALALAGCGGDDGIDQSVHDMALAAQAEAEQKAADEKAARMAAEEEAADAATTAEEARMQAEADAAAAAQAEEDREAAAAAQAAADMKAEEEAAAAKKAEEDRMAEEAARIKAEEEAAAAEAARMKAEEARIAAEAAAAKALMDVQMAADAAAMAAKTASDAAAMDATAAMTATANIATLQTGEMSKMMAYDAKKAADGAMKAYMAAKTASEAANADDATIETATTARDMAVAAQMDAEKYAMTADEESKGAVKYAMTELMIDGTMKSVGGSSIDARMGTLTEGTASVDRMITGFLDDVSRDTVASEGQHFVQGTGPADETKYKQAVAAGSINIGKTLDTTDDTARLRLITSYQGSRTVRIFADGNGEASDATLGGILTSAVTDLDGFPLAEDADTTTDGTQTATIKSIGVYYQANRRDETADPFAATGIVGTAATVATTLDAYDRVSLTDGGQAEEIFELSYGTNTHHARVVETITDNQGVTTKHYQPVDIMANASMTDGGDNNETADDLRPVMTSIPLATEYDHLHFGVWASLGEADKDDGAQMLADLGIGFVQNFSESGITDKQGIGTATFNGDWVAAVQRAHGEGEGAITLADGKATLTANFGTDKFTGTLTGLARLEGSLSGNGFSGMKATVADNAYGVTAGATLEGMFSGGIYGPDGEEAGGVFDFSSESDGAFVGAFGGARDGS